MDAVKDSTDQVFGFLSDPEVVLPEARNDEIIIDVFRTLDTLFASGACERTADTNKVKNTGILSAAMAETLLSDYEALQEREAVELRVAGSEEGLLWLEDGTMCHVFLVNGVNGARLYLTTGWEHDFLAPGTDAPKGCVVLGPDQFNRLLLFVGRENPFRNAFMKALQDIVRYFADDLQMRHRRATQQLGSLVHLTDDLKRNYRYEFPPLLWSRGARDGIET